MIDVYIVNVSHASNALKNMMKDAIKFVKETWEHIKRWYYSLPKSLIMKYRQPVKRKLSTKRGRIHQKKIASGMRIAPRGSGKLWVSRCKLS